MLYLLYFILLIVWGCTDSPQSHKGGIWDETENSVVINAKTSAGKPLIGSPVYLYTQNDWTQNTLQGVSSASDSSITDSNGQALLKTSSWPAYVLLDSPEGVQSRVIHINDTLLSMSPKPVSVIQGILQPFNNQELPEKLLLLGTPYFANISENGSFTFSSVSSGNHTLIALYSHSIQPVASFTISPGDTNFLSTIQLPDITSTLIEDFEDKDNQHRFGPLLGSGWWFTYSDTLGMVYPSQISEGIETSADSWDNGSSLHMFFGKDNSEANWYGLCGFNIDLSLSESVPNQSFHDATPMQAISFMAKGHGRIQIQLNGPHPQRAVYTHELDSLWENIEIPLIEFQYEGSKEYIISHISNISFLALEKTELWLDNIQFHHLSPQFLFQELANTP